MNIGLHDGIIHEDHRQKMGEAIWLYKWLVKRQTRRNGLVLGGAPITYDRIHQETLYPVRNMQRWMARLREKAYVEVTYLNYKAMKIRILRPKKFGFKQIPLPLEQTAKSGGSSQGVPPAKSGGSVPPYVADGSVKSGGSKQSGTLSSNETPERERALPDGIAGLVPLPLWLDFIAIRIKKHKPNTPGVVAILTRKLLELQFAGDDPILVIEQSVVHAWPDIYPLKKENNVNGTQRKSREQERNDRSAAALADVFGSHRVVPGGVCGDVPRRDHGAASPRLPGSAARAEEPGTTASSVHASDAVIDVSAEPARDPGGLRGRVRERAKAETA
jgi:hypothetical protein